MKRRTFVGSIGLGVIAGVSQLNAQGFQFTGRSRDVLDVLSEVNRHRAVQSLNQLKAQPILQAAAQDQAFHIQKIAVAVHTNEHGLTPDKRCARLGYQGRVLGETLSQSHNEGMDAARTWFDVAETRDVLLNPLATEIGVGMAKQTGSERWLVAVLA